MLSKLIYLVRHSANTQTGRMVLIYFKFLVKKIIQFKKYIICAALLVVACVTILKSDFGPDLYFLTLEEFEDVSCYYSHVDDALPRIEEDFAPPAKSIHFHETSCRGRLNSRQACSVESAARMHPDWQIHVFFAGPVPGRSLKLGSAKALSKYDNIKFLRLHLIDYAKGTPLQDFVSAGGLNRTRWRISHTSDALRFLSLFKWGGVYLDLDMVVAKPFDELAPNWAARETEISVAAGGLAFSRDPLGRDVAQAAIVDFKKNFRGDMWGHNGPGVITRVLTKMCSVKNMIDMSTVNCKGFEVYGPELFYPVSWLNANDLFKDEELRVGDPFTYHIWNKRTETYAVEKNSSYARLAEKYCPEVFNAYGDNFGL